MVARLTQLEQEFHAEQASFTANYSMLRVEAAREWWEAARKLVSDPDRLVATIESSFPHPDQMERYFSFNTHLFQVSIPDGAPKLDIVTAADQQAIAEARNQAARDAAAKIRRGADEFVSQCVATLRQEAAGLADEILQSMHSGKTQGVHQKSLNRLVRFIDEKFKALNFSNDEEFERILEQAKSDLLSRSAEEYRNDVFAEERLKTGLAKLRDTAKEMAHADAEEIVERFGQMGRRRFNLAA